MVANLLPAAPEPRDRVRALPPPAAPGTASIGNIAARVGELFEAGPDDPVLAVSAPVSLPVGPVAAGEASVVPEVVPVPSVSRVEFTFVAPAEVRDLLDAARDYLRHKFPKGRMEEIVGEALRRLVERERSERARAGRKSSRPPRKSRKIPKAVRAEVWRRDGGVCAFVGPGGRRCGERAWLEYDHVRPWDLGGASDSAGNVRLLCRAHNQARIIPRKGPPA